MTTVAERLIEVRGRIDAAARGAGRDPAEVTLVAISKKQPFERLLEAYAAGVRDFGENTAQGLVERVEAFEAAGVGADIRWHFVGQLQSNKVKTVAPRAWRIHSLDRVALAETLSKRAGGVGVDVLVQVNLAGEAQKGGVSRAALEELVNRGQQQTGLRIRGLMTVPPAGEDPLPYFQSLQGLLDGFRERSEFGSMTELSMGMSGDYDIAVACGATFVRVGSAIFGARVY